MELPIDVPAFRDLMRWTKLSTYLLPSQTEIIFIHGETRENEMSVLGKAAMLGKRIAFADVELNASGYSGFSEWREILLSYRVPKENIVGIPNTFVHRNDKGTLIANTGDEARGFVAYAKKNRLRAVAIMAPEFHILRCLMTDIGEAMREYPELRIHPILGNPLPWDEVVKHSQDNLEDRRAWLMIHEMLAILTYKNIPAPEAVIDYLRSTGQWF